LSLICSIVAFANLIRAQPPPEVTTVSGTVTRADSGEPVAQASVQLQRFLRGDEVVGYRGGRIQTDADGKYLFEGVEEGEYSLSVSAPDLVNEFRHLKVGAEPRTEDFQLYRYSTVSGRLFAPDGQPVAETQVHLGVAVPTDQFWMNLRSQQTTTDAAGQYALSQAAAEAAQVVVIVPGVGCGASGRFPIPKGQDVDGVDVRLTAGETFPVQVREEDTKNPLSGVNLYWQYNLGGNFLQGSSVLTDAAGRCTLTGLPPGVYQLHLTCSGFENRSNVTALLFPGQPELLFEMKRKPGATPIAGRVVGVDGKTPVARRELRCYLLEMGKQPWEQYSPPAASATDEEGRFRFYWEQPGKWRVVAIVPGVGYAASDPLTLKANQPVEGLNFTLSPTATLSGVVRNDRGEPAPDWPVQIWPTSSSPLYHYRMFTPGEGGLMLQTDPRGRFRLRDLIPDRYQLYVSREGRLAASETVTLKPGEEREIQLRVKAGITLAGRLLGPDGRTPVANTQVTLQFFPTPVIGLNLVGAQTVTTDATGAYRMGSVSDRAHYAFVHLAGRGYARSERFEAAEGETVEGVDLTLQPGVTLSGIVLDGDTEQPVGGAEVKFILMPLAEQDYMAYEMGQVTSDDAGRFTLRGLPPGKYRLTVFREGSYAQGVVLARPAQEMNVLLRLGSVRPPSAPLPEVRVRVVAEDGETPVVGAVVQTGSAQPPTTDAQGCFRWNSAVGNPFYLMAAGYARRLHTIPETPAGGEVTIVLRARGGTISGRVTRGDTGEPVPKAQVGAVPADDFYSFYSDLSFAMGRPPYLPDWNPSARTDADGRYALTHVPEGRHVVYVLAEGFLNTCRPGVRVREGETVAVDLVLEDPQARRLAGRIVDQAGQPVVDGKFRVDCYRQTRHTFLHYGDEITTDAQGGYTLQLPRPGRYRLWVRDREYGEITAWLDAPDDAPLPPQELRFIAGPPGGLAGRIFQPDGTPAAGAKLAPFRAMLPHWGRAYPDPRPENDCFTVAAADGSFAVPGLPPFPHGLYAPVDPLLFGDEADRLCPALLLGQPLTPGETAEGLTLRFLQGGVLAGTVVDAASGEPLAEATVWPRPWPDRSWYAWENPFQLQGVDDQGAFRCAHLPPGLYRLYAWANGYAAQQETVSVGPGTEQADFTFRLRKIGWGNVVGRVFLPDGETPADQAQIYVERLFEDARVDVRGPDRFTLPDLDVRGPEACTAGDGTFLLPHLEAGRYRLRAWKVDCAFTPAEVKVEQDATAAVTITLTAGGTVRGRVLAADGQTPAAETFVFLAPPHYDLSGFNFFEPYHWLPWLERTETAADGTFSFPSVPPGPARLFAFADDAIHDLRGITVAEGATTEVNLQLGSLAGRITGTVRGPNGQPLPAAFLRLASDENPRLTLERLTDDAGRYEFDALPLGTYTVYAEAPGLANRMGLDVSLPADAPEQTVDFDLTPGGAVAGRVRDAEGQPLAGAWVATFAPADVPRVLRGGLSVQGVRTAADGTYHLGPLAPGTYDLIVSVPGRPAPVRRAVVVEEEKTSEGIEVTLGER